MEVGNGSVFEEEIHPGDDVVRTHWKNDELHRETVFVHLHPFCAYTDQRDETPPGGS